MTPALTDKGFLATALDCLETHISIDMHGVCSLQTLFTVLLRAASHTDSIEHTSQRLTGVPTGKGLRYHLDKLDDMATLAAQLNAALHHQLPSKVFNHRHRLAIDLHLLPFYGHPNAAEVPYIYRSQAKAGTTSFFAYASVYYASGDSRQDGGVSDNCVMDVSVTGHPIDLVANSMVMSTVSWQLSAAIAKAFAISMALSICYTLSISIGLSSPSELSNQESLPNSDDHQ